MQTWQRRAGHRQCPRSQRYVHLLLFIFTGVCVTTVRSVYNSKNNKKNTKQQTTNNWWLLNMKLVYLYVIVYTTVYTHTRPLHLLCYCATESTRNKHAIIPSNRPAKSKYWSNWKESISWHVSLCYPVIQILVSATGTRRRFLVTHSPLSNINQGQEGARLKVGDAHKTAKTGASKEMGTATTISTRLDLTTDEAVMSTTFSSKHFPKFILLICIYSTVAPWRRTTFLEVFSPMFQLCFFVLC